MSRKPNVRLTISVVDGGAPHVYRDPSYLDWVPNSPSESESPPLSPKKTEKKAHRVGFVTMESDKEDDKKKNDIDKDFKKFSRKGLGSCRFTEPRLSLLGKPLNYRAHRKDARMRRLQAKIYNFLERPKWWLAAFYHFLMFFAVVSCLVLSVLASIKSKEVDGTLLTRVVMFIEPFVLVWLIVEYGVRIWASGCRSRYQGMEGRFRFIRRPLCIVDMIVILASIIILCLSAGPLSLASSIGGLRFFQILRMVRMDRRGGTWKLLGSVIWAHRQELITTLYIGLLGLLFFSFLVFLAENNADRPKFRSYADALWWGVITLCTVGYGDVVPTTWAGKVIASFSAILGISFFALPAGILGSGFALKVQQQQRQKHLIRRRVPAAQLIQCLWRCYAADENSMSIATWKPHMIPCPSPTAERQFKNNTSFVSRFSTRRRERSSGNHYSSNPHSPLIPRKEVSKKTQQQQDTEEVPDAINSLVNRTWSHLSLATGLADQKVDHLAPGRKEHHSPSFSFSYDDEAEQSPQMTQLTDVHKRVIRGLRKIKYFVARRKFKEALRPYDVKDVIEQYSAGHVDMLGRIKSLQQRLDVILGKQGSKRKDVYESKQSLASRVVKVERSVEDIESKLDLLFDMYKEDRKILLQHCHSCSTPSSNTPSTEVASCLKNSGSLKHPRSILSDKQSSEPTSPTVRNQERSMQRNLSDLSQRIKKRVTYRLLSLNDQHITKSNEIIEQPKRQRSVSFDEPNNDSFEECKENSTYDTKVLNDPKQKSISEIEPKVTTKRKLSRSFHRITDSEQEDESDDTFSQNDSKHSFQNRTMTLDFKPNNVNCSNENSLSETVNLLSFPGYKPK